MYSKLFEQLISEDSLEGIKIGDRVIVISNELLAVISKRDERMKEEDENVEFWKGWLGWSG